MKYVNDILMTKLKSVSLYTTSDLSIFNKNEIKKLAHLFDEGNKKFRQVINKLFQEGIPTVASCIGHKKNEKGYIEFQLNDDNFYSALDIALGLAEKEDVAIDLSTSFFKNPANMTFRFDKKDRDKIYDKILKWQIGNSQNLSIMLSKQYYIVKMISQRTSFLYERFTVDLKDDEVELSEVNKIECTIKNYKDYDNDCQNAIKIQNILSNSDNLTQIYNEIKKIPSLSGEKVYWFNFDDMNIEEMKLLLNTITNSHEDMKITGMENPIIQNLYVRFEKRCSDLQIPIDIREFYNILLELEEELKQRIAKLNYQRKSGKSY